MQSMPKTIRPAALARHVSLLLLLIIRPAVADLATERSAVLRSFGEVRDTALILFPVRQETGKIFTQNVAFPGVESLRLHFVRLDNAATDGTWELRLLQDGTVLTTLTHEELESGSYWTDEYTGAQIQVELHSTTSANLVRLKIEHVAVGITAPARLSTVGANQLSAIWQHATWVQEIGDSIARLSFAASDGKLYKCTGFMLTRALLITNQHCISGRRELESAIVDFDYDTKVAETVFTRLGRMLACDYGLDYSIVELKNPADRAPLPLANSSLNSDEKLLIIQHPGGEPQQVSIEDCHVGNTRIVGRDGNSSDFEHFCDTETGSSGAPVIHRENRTVVGLHHLGFEEDDEILLNRAVHIGQIIDDLDAPLRDHILGEPGDNGIDHLSASECLPETPPQQVTSD